MSLTYHFSILTRINCGFNETSQNKYQLTVNLNNTYLRTLYNNSELPTIDYLYTLCKLFKCGTKTWLIESPTTLNLCPFNPKCLLTMNSRKRNNNKNHINKKKCLYNL